MSEAMGRPRDWHDGEMVVDIGAGESHDPRATATLDAREGVADYQANLDESWPFPDASVDGLIARHVFEHVADPEHFFTEAGRVLRSGGWLEVTVPLGKNAVADDDHTREWQWTTPTHYCRESQRGWDVETQFRLESRTLNASLQGFLAPFNPAFQLLARLSPGEAAYRASAGELTARYRRVSDEN